MFARLRAAMDERANMRLDIGHGRSAFERPRRIIKVKFQQRLAGSKAQFMVSEDER